MHALNIRTGLTSEAELIADLSRSTFYESFESYNTRENMDKFMNEQFTREGLIREVGAAGNTFLLAFLEDQPVGYALVRERTIPIRPTEPSSIELARIYAKSEHIGKGVGAALLRAAIEIAIEKEKKSLWLGVWEHNHRAIAFYTKAGFKKMGEHVFLLGDDPQTDWLMKKELGVPVNKE